MFFISTFLRLFIIPFEHISCSTVPCPSLLQLTLEGSIHTQESLKMFATYPAIRLHKVFQMFATYPAIILRKVLKIFATYPAMILHEVFKHVCHMPSNNTCARSCEPGSQCRPNECISGVGKLRGVGIGMRGI
jgi:hypothetical protein